MVAVSVDMLTTGFDCPDVLHVVLARRIFSPILYQQIRGRGTRRCDRIGKKRFVIYDFFRNHEYFNDSETDIFTGSGGGMAGTGWIETARHWRAHRTWPHRRMARSRHLRRGRPGRRARRQKGICHRMGKGT